MQICPVMSCRNSSENAAMLSSFRHRTNLAQLHHAGGGEISPLATLQPPEPPLLLMFGQHQDDVTCEQLQLVGPLGLVAVDHCHLQGRNRSSNCAERFITYLNLRSALLHPRVVPLKVTVFSSVHKTGSMNGED